MYIRTRLHMSGTHATIFARMMYGIYACINAHKNMCVPIEYYVRTFSCVQAYVFVLYIYVRTSSPSLAGAPVEGLTSKTVIICLHKEGNNSFGFTVRGGRTENRPVTVAHIRQGSHIYQ